MNNHIIAGADPRTDLEAAVAAFFASGGQAVQIESKEVPLPFRSERIKPETVLKRSRRRVTPNKLEASTEADELRRIQRETDESDRLDTIRGMAWTMSQIEVARATGINPKALRRIAEQNGFQFSKAKKITPRKGPSIEDAPLVSAIINAREQGLSRTAARKHLQMGSYQFHRLIALYAIEYPLCPAFDRYRKDGPL